MSKKWDVKTVGEYLKDQPYIVSLDLNDKGLLKDTDDDNSLVKNLRTIYKSKILENEVLKMQLILLENKKIEIVDYNMVGNNSIVFSTFMSFLAICVAVVNSLLPASANSAINASNIEKKLEYFLYALITVIFMLFIIYLLGKFDTWTKKIHIKKRIAINIQKSVIEERLSEIEGDNKEQENKTIKKLEEIEKTMEGTNREVETLIRVFGKIQK